MTFLNKETEALGERIRNLLSEPRYLNTLGVARSARKLSELCLPELASESEVAALLHDVTKEYTHSEQMKIIKENKIPIDSDDEKAPAVLHSFTAPVVIKRDFPEFATDNVLSSVFFHTVGSPDMTVFDEIVFLADFIEETRTYPSSVAVRNYVFDNMKPGNIEENVKVLHKACIMSIDFTEKHLKSNNKPINPKNILTRNALLSKI